LAMAALCFLFVNCDFFADDEEPASEPAINQANPHTNQSGKFRVFRGSCGYNCGNRFAAALKPARTLYRGASLQGVQFIFRGNCGLKDRPRRGRVASGRH
jgi:hypothetical protein